MHSLTNTIIKQLDLQLSNPNVKVKPLLKWPGGKRLLLKHILPLLPLNYKCYYEPFCGGGALFFNLLPNNAVISDSNSELINCYEQVKQHPYEVISHLKKLPNTKDDYYRIRSQIPQDSIQSAARFIYLTTLSFNGIYRLNQKGEFNVPYGYKTYINPCDINKILVSSEALSSTNLICCDFEESTYDAKSGDLVYFDPPYTVAHGNNGFVKYNAKIFSWDDQIRLAQQARRLVKRGCKVIISNAHHTSILELYTDFKCKVINRSSVIASSDKYRRDVLECIFYNEV